MGYQIKDEVKILGAAERRSQAFEASSSAQLRVNEHAGERGKYSRLERLTENSCEGVTKLLLRGTRREPPFPLPHLSSSPAMTGRASSWRPVFQKTVDRSC